MQLAQSRVGKTLLSRIIFPPTLALSRPAGPCSPYRPSLRADSMPPMPLPITNTSYFNCPPLDAPVLDRAEVGKCLGELGHVLTNGSAQTEHIAAIFTRRGSCPFL